MEKTKIIAHRGSKGTHPENTLIAFEEAIRVGSDGIELDVHLTKDGKVVVIHDETVNRTSDGKGLVRDFTLEELKRLDTGSWFDSIYGMCTIPTLKEVVDLLNRYSFKGLLNVEFKTNNYSYPGIEKKVVEILSKQSNFFSIVFSSFNYQTLIRLKKIENKAQIALLFKGTGKNKTVLEQNIPIEMWHTDLAWFKNTYLTEEFEMPIRLWTINNEEDLIYCFDKKVAGIFTDFPEKALTIQQERQRVKPKILVVVGPTAVGKTSLSIELAKEYNGEIISGDSMQIYQKLDIGTAKVSLAEQDGIVHHLIDEVTVTNRYSVSDFQKKGRQLIYDCITRGKTPIIVGGTGLYIESILYDVSLGGTGESNLDFRAKKESEAQKLGVRYLWNELEKIDPVSAKAIHANNVRRVIRALEVHHTTGVLFSNYQGEREEKELLFDVKIIGLTTDRSILYERINQRVYKMMEQGLESEARWLYNQNIKDSQAMRGIGYKEWIPYFENEGTIENVITEIQQNSRRYAKRQLTWFKNRTKNVSWWDLVDEPESKEKLKQEIKCFLSI
ncbi:tRNA (adenosine(37)-N6)-dimethylallyltransferase MiaA [Carnobacterium sp. TMP28]|uniref:tRNA (adenosine(37)-N6)-dimethylallyltransferase MiaA n=1 Tax=Carnobacterium sp. TMP28 TaxID=3397060 RepID=UPI0039E05C8D